MRSAPVSSAEKPKRLIVGGIANKENRPVAERLSLMQSLQHQGGSDPETADLGGDCERSEQQARVTTPGDDRP